MTVLRLLPLLAILAFVASPTGGKVNDWDDAPPSPYMPDENQGRAFTSSLNEGRVLSITDRVIVFQVLPNTYGTFEKDGTVTKYLEIVPAEPQKYYLHPCLWNGGLAVDATDNFSFSAKDVKAGDCLRVDYVTDTRGNRWVSHICIWRRPGGALPPERRKGGVDADGSTTVERMTARLFRIHDAKMQQQAGGK